MKIDDFLLLIVVVLAWIPLSIFSPYLATYATLIVVIVALVIVVRGLRDL